MAVKKRKHPDHYYKILELAKAGKQRGEIAIELGLPAKLVSEILTKLRKEYGADVVPYSKPKQANKGRASVEYAKSVRENANIRTWAGAYKTLAYYLRDTDEVGWKLAQELAAMKGVKL
jgi:hypothetical protein